MAAKTKYTESKQRAPGASAAVGHTVENSIPLSIFPIQMDKFCICVLGLPGVGKTHISNRLARYLNFFHAVPVEIYNASEYRRKAYGIWASSTWFDTSNEEAKEKLKKTNDAIISDMVTFLNSNSNGVAILDSSSLLSTYQRRLDTMNAIHATGAKVMFVEVSRSTTEDISIPFDSPDYYGLSREAAEEDFRKRVEFYKIDYESLDSNSAHDEHRWSYLKCDHKRQHFVIHKVSGYLQLKVVHFVMNLRTEPHTFYLSRHGQSEYNAVGRIGGDSGLSQHGLNYAHKLAEFTDNFICKNPDGTEKAARLWTSTMRRTKETAQFILSKPFRRIDQDDPSLEHEWVQMRPRAWHHIDELFAGSCDGMTYEEIEEQFPEEFERRKTDKLAYRYPRGESYLDVIARLEPIIIEMERHREPLLIVSHQGILRIIYAFYMGLTRAEAPYVSIPLNTVTQLSPSAFNCDIQKHVLYKIELAADGQDEPLAVRMERQAAITDPASH